MEVLGSGNLTLIQLIFDAVLLVCLLLLIFWIRRPQSGSKSKEPIELGQVEELLAASEELAQRLEGNLKEKRAIINELMARLDEKGEELRDLIAQARQAARSLEPAASGRSCSERAIQGSEQTPAAQREERVLVLFREGLSVSEIAGRLRLPKAEVELILSLHRAGRGSGV